MANKKINPTKQLTVKNKLTKSGTEKYTGILFYFLLTALVFLIYAKVLGYPLGKLDEDDILTKNLPYISNFGNVFDAFFRGAFFNNAGILFWRPLQNISYMIDAQLSGGSLWGFYLGNIVIHLLTSFALFELIKKLNFSTKSAAVSVAVFALNPLFAHSLSWTPSRGDLLTGLFGVLSFLVFLYYLQKKNTIFIILTALFYFAMLLSKESTGLFPVVFIVYIIVKEGGLSALRKHIPFFAVNFVFAVFYLILRQSIATGKSTEGSFGFSEILLNFQVLPELFGKYFIPVNLSPMPSYTMVSTLTGLSVMVVVLYLCLKNYQKGSVIIWVSLSWFFVTVFPGMLFSRDSGNSYNYLEHRDYLPAIGLAMLVAWLIQLIKSEKNFNKAVYSLILVSLLFGSISFFRADNYKNGMAFYDYAVVSNPSSAMAFANRGTLHKNAGDKEAALSDYNEAIRLKIDYYQAYNNRGSVLSDFNRNIEALADYNKSIEIKPDYADAYYNRGITEFSMNLPTEAIKDFTTAVTLNKKYAQAYVNRCNVYKKLGDFTNALADCNIAISINPNLNEAWQARANIRFHQNDFKGSIEDYSSAINLNPKLPELFLNRGAARFQLKDFRNAIDDFTSALNLNPRLPDAIFYRGLSYNATGNISAACADFLAAAAMGNPNAAALAAQLCK